MRLSPDELTFWQYGFFKLNADRRGPCARGTLYCTELRQGHHPSRRADSCAERVAPQPR